MRNQNQTLLSISAAVFICVILYLPTYQFVAVSFFLKKARAYYNFWGRSSGEEGVRDWVRIRVRVKVSFFTNMNIDRALSRVSEG